MFQLILAKIVAQGPNNYQKKIIVDNLALKDYGNIVSYSKVCVEKHLNVCLPITVMYILYLEHL